MNIRAINEGNGWVRCAVRISGLGHQCAGLKERARQNGSNQLGAGFTSFTGGMHVH